MRCRLSFFAITIILPKQTGTVGTVKAARMIWAPPTPHDKVENNLRGYIVVVQALGRNGAFAEVQTFSLWQGVPPLLAQGTIILLSLA